MLKNKIGKEKKIINNDIDYISKYNIGNYLGLSFFEKITGKSFNLEKQYVKSNSDKKEDDYYKYLKIRRGQENSFSTPLDNLEFILKNEFDEFMLLGKGNIIKILELLNQEELENSLNITPNSKSLRKIGYLYEIYLGKELNINKLKHGLNYELILDEDKYICKPNNFSIKSEKFKILDNNLGELNGFNPIVKNNNNIKEIINKDINLKLSETLSEFSEKVIKNAIKFMYTKETKGSLEIEEELFDNTKNRGFLELISNIPKEEKLSKENLLKYYDIIFGSKIKTESYRNDQNYIGSTVKGNSIIDYIPPKPNDVDKLMEELLDFYNKGKQYINPVLLASIVSTQFVYIHPFLDGNGRTSRFFIHYVLQNNGILIDLNLILPLSAYILTHRDEYYEKLESISKGIKNNINYTLKGENDFNIEIEVLGETKGLYDKIDYTNIVEYYYKVITNSIDVEFKNELIYINSYYEIYDLIDKNINIDKKSLNAIVNFYIQGEGIISNNKKKLLENKMGVSEKVISDIVELIEKRKTKK